MLSTTKIIKRPFILSIEIVLIGDSRVELYRQLNGTRIQVQ